MATENYNFPEINPAAPFDGANDINKLAAAIDTSMKEVELLGKAAQFELPAATTTTLGGVKPDGTTVKVAGDGTITTKVDAYKLPPASRGELGGVIVKADSGFNLKPDGELSIDPQSVALPPNSVGTDEIQDSAVTTAKLAAGAVTREKLSESLQELFDNSSDYVNGVMKELTLVPNSLIPGFTKASVKVFSWGPVVVVQFINADLNVSSPGDTFNVGTVPQAQLPKSLHAVDNAAPGVAAQVEQLTKQVGWVTISSAGAITLKFGATLEANNYKLGGTSTVMFL